MKEVNTRVSVIIPVRNEEKHIRDCIASVRDFTDEILVLDSLSTDRTVEFARESGARIESRPFDNYPAQRNHAIDLARSDWIFFIDADERAAPGVGQEIRAQIESCNSQFVIQNSKFHPEHYRRVATRSPNFEF